MGTKVFVQNYLFLFIVVNRCRILIIFEDIASLTVVSATEMKRINSRPGELRFSKAWNLFGPNSHTIGYTL